MRRVLLAVLLLTASLAGCGGTSEEGPVAHQPAWPDGLLLSYEVTAGGQTSEETFLVRNASQQGPELSAWNLSRPNLTSPFLELNDDYNPRDTAWAGLFDWPIQPGDENEGRIAETPVTVSWSRVDHEGPLDTDTDLEGVAVTEDGEQIARFRVSTGAGTAFTLIEVDAPDGTEQTWRLTGTDVREAWDEPPAWSKGDWWTYEGSFQNRNGTSQIVYTRDQETQQSDHRLLEPVRFQHRDLTLPFQGWRDTDIAPQSGFVSGMLSSFWNWPLHEGRTWSGTTSAVDGGAQYQAVTSVEERVQLPDGSYSTTFLVEAYVPGEEEPFAVYEYSPRAEHLTQWRITEPGAASDELNFTLVDWGEAYHGELEIPQREALADLPVTSGPATIERSVNVSEQAVWVRIAPHSFAVHDPDADPSFHLRLEGPNGTLVAERNGSDFTEGRMDLSGRVAAAPGTWNLTIEMGEEVSIRLLLEAIWYQTETVDFR